MKITTSNLFIFGMAGALLSGLLIDWLVKKKGLRFGRRFVGMTARLTRKTGPIRK